MLLTPPSTGVIRSLGQSLHFVAPTSGEYWLSGQNWQTSAALVILNEPGAQFVQTEAPTAAEKVPGAQVDTKVAPKAFPKKPFGAVWHTDCPEVAANLPSGHERQLT